MPERAHDSHPSDDADTPDEPGTVAGFRLLRKVGEGGMSAVYQSYDVGAARTVAVKLLADHLASQPEFVGRFYREARLSRVLEHPNVVQGYASGFDPEAKKHFLVLEFIDGPTAHGALTHLGRLPVGAVVRIGIDIARALDFLHERLYVHRDVKPDNILLHPSGVAKLADLGLAKRLNDESQLTAVHQGVGTSYYMPYEQAVNANLVDGRSDIFALGATLYHLLTGEVPFPGATHDEVVREKWEGSFRPIREVHPDVPASVAALVEATLALDPRARVQKAADLAAALDATGLATPIPLLPARGEPGPWSLAGSEAPTRTDHPVRAPSPSPAVPPNPPTGDETSGLMNFRPLRQVPGAPIAPAPPPGRGKWFRIAGAGLLLVALGVGHLARAPEPRCSPTPLAMIVCSLGAAPKMSPILSPRDVISMRPYTGCVSCPN